MPVPTKMSDLSTLAASNSPTGTESIGNSLDNYMRAHAMLIRHRNALASAAIASASTVDVANADGESVQITGTTTITSLGTGFNGCYRELRFAGALTLTHSSSLKLPNSTNITTAADDVLGFRCVGSNQWVLCGLAPVRGPAVLKAGDTGLGQMSYSADLTDKISLFDSRIGQATMYGFGVELNYLYCRSASGYRWYSNTLADGGTSDIMELTTSGNLTISGGLTATSVSVGGSPLVTEARTISAGTGLTGGGSLAANRTLSVNTATVWTTSTAPTDSKKLSKITVSSSAPGTLADGELYLKY